MRERTSTGEERGLAQKKKTEDRDLVARYNVM